MTSLRRTLLCRIDACPGSHLIEGSKWLERSVDAACVHDLAVDRFRKKVARRFRLKIEGAWITATLDDSSRPFLDHMREQARLGIARLDDGYLTERMEYSDRFEWYRLAPELEFNPRNRKRGSAELLTTHYGWTYGSSRFREAVEHAGLRGLCFGPPTSGPIRGDRRCWYACLPGALAGRGLDHEWAPPNEEDVIEGNGRIGADSARNDTAAIDRLDPDVAELCGLFPLGKLQLKSFPRLWAGSIPDVDFVGLVGVAATRQWHVNSICIRRSAVAALLAAGVLEPAMLEPIGIVETRGEARVSILDEVVGPLPGSLTAMIAGRRSVEVPEEGDDDPSESRESPRALVIPAWITGEDGVPEDEIRRAESRMGVALPRIWSRFLSEIGMVGLWDLSPHHPSGWADSQPDHDDLRAGDDSLPSRMLAVGSTLNGDWYSLDLDHVTDDGDCPLLKFDHEINRCIDRWPSVTQFINECLSDPPGE